MADTVHNLDQPIGALIDIAVREFGEVEFETVNVGGMSLEVLQIKNMQQYLDKLIDKTRAGKKITLPLWAKIWPSSLILGYTLTKFPFPDDCSILEVGAGGAVNSLVLAKLGHQVSVSDVDSFALLFSKINALKNGVDDKLTLHCVDFTTDAVERRFDYIIGCEVLYAEAAFEPLLKFLSNHLSDNSAAEIVLAMDQKRQGREFFDMASEQYSMMKSAAKYKDRETGEENVVNLFRMKRKQA